MTKQFLKAIQAQETARKLGSEIQKPQSWDGRKPRGPNLTEAEKDAICAMRKDGYGYRQIAAKLGHSYCSVYNTLNRRGAPTDE